MNAIAWREILSEYDATSRRDNVHQIDWFRRQASLRDAIDVAARAVDERGRRYSHQRRIRRATILQAKAALLSIESQIEQSRTFDSLIGVIHRQLAPIDGAGLLYIYDAAFRLGAYVGVFPERVYLHAGTRDGAKKLGLNWRKKALNIDEFPAELRDRPAHEIEDILCIYKGWFDGSSLRRGCPPSRKSKCS